MKYHEKGMVYLKQAMELGNDCAKVYYWYLTNPVSSHPRFDHNQLTTPLSLGLYYDRIMGMLDTAFKYYEESAQQGNELGQWNLGLLYSNVFSTHVDYHKATEWYLKSAEQGFGQAQSTLGHSLITNSMGKEHWLKKARAQNVD
jgi:TPR repeat protein